MSITIFFRWLIVLGMLYMGACKKTEKDYHPQYFAKFHTQLDSTYSLTQRWEILDSLESALHQYPIGVGDKAQYYRERMAYWLDTKNYTNVFLYLDSIDDIIKGKMDDPYFAGIYVGGLTIRSECYMQMNNYDAALDYQFRAMGAKKLQGLFDSLDYNERMANLHYQMGRYKLAAGYSKKIIDATERGNLPPFDKFASIQAHMDNVGLCYAGAGMYDSAGYYYQQALDYIDQLEALYPQKNSNLRLAKATIKGNFAKVKLINKDYGSAESMILENIAFIKGIDDHEALFLQSDLANVYLEWNKPEKAEKLLEELDSLCHFQIRPDTLRALNMAWNLQMQKLYEGKGDIKKAFAYNRQYMALRNSRAVVKKYTFTRDLTTDLESMEQAGIKASLEKGNQKKSFHLTIAFVLSVIGIVSALFVWNNLWRTAKQEKALQVLNREIEEKNEAIKTAFESLAHIRFENSKITKMIAHDLKNPIGGIRTLVYSFLKQTQPDETKRWMKQMEMECNRSIVIINGLLNDKQIDQREL